MTLRLAIIAFLAIGLGTSTISRPGNATAITSVDVGVILLANVCPSPGDCVAELEPANVLGEAVARAAPGMNVDDTETRNFSLHLMNSADAPSSLDLRVSYRFGINVTNGLLDSGEYDYSLIGINFGLDDRSHCSYPSDGLPTPGFSPPIPTPGPGNYCVVSDLNDFQFIAPPGTDETFDFTLTVHAQAASVPEPFSGDVLVSALILLFWFTIGYRRSVPVTTISTFRLPQAPHTGRECHSGTGISAP